MEAIEVRTQMSPCDKPLPEIEVPMINTMVTCLGSQNGKLDDLILQLASAASSLAANPDTAAAEQRAVEVWDEIRRDLWSHLQIEDELVLSWGEAHHAISGALLDTLKIERQEMGKLVAALPASFSGADREPQTAADRVALGGRCWLWPDSHVERYDYEALPSIRRALFQI